MEVMAAKAAAGAVGAGLMTPATGAAMVGAASSVGTVGAISGGLSLLSGVQSARQQQYAADVSAEGMKAQAYQEKLRAQEEGNLRRERLLKALASQNVRAGAAGVSGGTVDALRLESEEAYGREQRGASLMSSLEQKRLKSGAAETSRAGKYQARGSLLTTATQLASIG